MELTNVILLRGLPNLVCLNLPVAHFWFALVTKPQATVAAPAKPQVVLCVSCYSHDILSHNNLFTFLFICFVCRTAWWMKPGLTSHRDKPRASASRAFGL